MPQEGLYDPARARRTFAMSLAVLAIPVGAVVLVGVGLLSSHLPWWYRPGWAAVGLLLVLGGAAWLRALVRQGRKVGAVYGVKGAQRAGLLPPDPPRRG